MNYFYIDESGSMKVNQQNDKKYFITCIIKVNDMKVLERSYRKFVAEHIRELKIASKDKMFNQEGFKELKGSEFTIELKKKFVNYFANTKSFEIYYVLFNNHQVRDNFYDSTARAFNYVMSLFFKKMTSLGYFKYDVNYLHVDQRNLKKNTITAFEEYLNTELVTGFNIQKAFEVEYYNSDQLSLIQVADLFSNLMYSHIQTGNYDNEFKLLEETGMIKYIYEYPKEES
jgi:hypothetical protein